MKTMTFHFYADPGHGWLKVKTALLNKLGIEQEVSSYSYVRGEYVYLEEDCDASIFIDALKTSGVEPKYVEHVNLTKQSRIRNYSQYGVGY